MRRDERGEVRVPTPKQHRGAPVVHLRQAESAVLLRDLDPERAHREEVVDVLLRNFAGAIDLVGVDVSLEIFAAVP